MYKIKQLPEDFVVDELIAPDIAESGDFLLFWMKKRSYTTMRAVERIAESLRIKPKFIGFAGNKDRNAVTKQLISIKSVRKEAVESINMKDISLEYIGVSDKPVSMGTLDGNSFEITVRDVTADQYDSIPHSIPKSKLLVPNLFGEQRFSKNNAEIGKLLVKRDFKSAVELMLESDFQEEAVVRDFLDRNNSDYISALRKLPKKILLLYVHSYQSLLWNESVQEYLKIQGIDGQDPKAVMPMIGFGMEVKDKDAKFILDRIMARECIKERDFIIREIPEISSEGSERAMFVEPKDFSIGKLEDDELNEGKKKVLLRFSLPKGCYATVVIEFLFKGCQ